ncbi:MAG: HEAT repeat domain-containing protein [Lentisphaeria bacterium]|nr:HEAT repeat domain-containing protein [Lentisphaeria bacterium]
MKLTKKSTIHIVLCLLLSLFCAIADETSELETQKKLLTEYKITPTEAGIIKHLEEISPTEDFMNNIDALIKQLGESFRKRKVAQKKLIALGSLVEAKIRESSKSDDPEIKFRCQKILESISSNDSDHTLYTCLEFLKRVKAKQAVSAILNAAPLYASSYLKAAADTTLITLVQDSDLKTLEKALKHKELSIRSLAVNAYGKCVGAKNSEKLYPYLKAKKPEMRLAAAKAIANLGDRKALAAFIELMGDENLDIRSKSAQFLRQFTNQYFNYSAYDNKKNRDGALVLWNVWQEEKSPTAKFHFPLKAYSGNYLNGNTLIAMNGAIELDRKKKEIFRYTHPSCWTAEKLANGNYLIGSHNTKKLIEVTPKKKIVWEYPMYAMSAHQLPNGNILIATHGSKSVLEIRKKDKKIVWQYDCNVQTYQAYRLANGNTLVSGHGFIRILTPKKKVIWEYTNGQYFYGIQPLPNGNIMVSDNTGGIVYELNRKKERIWEYKVTSISVFKLRNGNVLIGKSNGIIEVTPKKEVIWNFGTSYGTAKR